MKQIRRKVFETNSSSSHSVSVPCSDASLSKLGITVNEKTDWQPGIIIDSVGFCSYYDHDTQEEKLAYLMQQLAYLNGFSDIFRSWIKGENLEEMLDDFYSCDDFIELEEQICEYADAKCLRFGDLGGYIDHDSVVYDKYELMDEIGGDYVKFVFADDSYVHFEFCG